MVSSESGDRTAVRRNIELKARCLELDAARAAALAFGAQPVRREHQKDTYYHSPCGRLKIRETRGRRALMIWYQRPDETGTRASEYRLTPVGDVPRLKSALAASMGVRGEVVKRRELLRYRNVRIHLDTVDRLGTFIEYEAVLGERDSEDDAVELIAQLCDAMAIQRDNTVAGSYADLLGI